MLLRNFHGGTRASLRQRFLQKQWQRANVATFSTQTTFRNPDPATILTFRPEEFVDEMVKGGTRRGYMIYDPKEDDIICSHPLFQPFADQCITGLGDLGRDFDEHEGAFFEIGSRSGCLMGGFVHRTPRGQAAGGVRFWEYNSVPEWICDGFRLSRGMSRKNASASLWHGGGKGVIARPSDEAKWKDRSFRDKVFQDYGDFLTSLKGVYVSAEDLGVTVEDVAQMFSTTRFTTCIPEYLGGSGNPGIPTSFGVVSAMEGGLHFLGQTLREKRVAIQGCGNVAKLIIEILLEKNVGEIVAVDCNPDRIAEAKDMFAGQPVDVSLVPLGDNSILYDDFADVVSPCATGGTLNEETISNIKAPLVCGAANNQLLDEVPDSELLKKHKITYVPDFIANRMGIVNCANESYGYVHNDPHIKRHYSREWEGSIFNMTQQILEKAEKDDITTSEAANRIADEMIKEEHPIWGHRPLQIIDTLIEAKWASQ